MKKTGLLTLMNPLPPSSMTVLRVLGNEGAMTHKDLVEKTRCKPRTVRCALKILKDRGLLVMKMNRLDMRQIIYQHRITPVTAAAETVPGSR